MKILVTGGAGLVGYNICKFYLEQGHEVVVMDNLERSDLLGHKVSEERLTYNKRLLEAKGAKVYTFDIVKRLNFDDVELYHGKFDAIFHMAAQCSVPSSIKDPTRDFEINSLGTLNILERARKWNSKVVYASCYDEKTRALTTEGLKRFDQLRKGDIVFSLNTLTGHLEHKKINRVIIQNYEGDLVAFKNKGNDLLVTPNHRMYVKVRRSDKMEVVPAESFLRNRNSDANSVRFKYVLPTRFEGKKDQITFSSQGLTSQSKQIAKEYKMEDLFYLLGLYIGDGSRQRQTKDSRYGTCTSSVIFLHIPKENRAREKAEKTIERLGLKPRNAFSRSGGEWGIFFSSKQFFDFIERLKFGDYAHEKTIPNEILEFDSYYLQFLYDGLMDSDGDGAENGRQYTTSSQLLAEKMVELCFKLGVKASIHAVKTREATIGERKITPTLDKAYQVYISRKNPILNIKTRDTSTRPYKGKIWCVEVEDNENLIVERNGKFVICGNTNKVYPLHDCFEKDEEDNRWHWSNKYWDFNGFPVSAMDQASRTPYGASKYAGDILCQEYYHTYGVETGIFRMSCIYGPNQFGFEEQGWATWFAIATLKGEPINIYGDGCQVRDMLYVDDLVKAYDSFIRSDVPHGVWNTGGGPSFTLSLNECLDILEELTGKRSPVKYHNWRPSDQKVYTSDIRQLKAKLDWEPEITPKEGLERVVEWIKPIIKIF